MYKNPQNNESQIIYLGEYKSYWSEFRRVKNPYYDKHSRAIWGAKEVYGFYLGKTYDAFTMGIPKWE